MPGAMRDAELAAILRAPFAEQVAFFRQKLGNLVSSEKWDDLWQDEHDRAFMVAGAATADLLADLAAAVDKAIADGETLQAFRKRFGEIVTRHGWAGWTGDDRTTDRPQGGKGVAWRTRVIYETNLITSYSAGRLAQLKDGGYEWWVYKHSDFVRRPRPHHVALDGVTRRADDPFWQTYSPPNGWGCRCRIIGARGPRDFARYGGDPDKPLPEWVGKPNPKSTFGTPIGIDDGFAYQPGATVADTVRALAKKLDSLPREVSIDVIQSWVKANVFAQWMADPAGDFPLARLPDADAVALGAKDGVRVAHLSAETALKQLSAHPEIAPAEYAMVQAVVDAPTYKVVDGKSVIYIREVDEGGGYVLVVKATRTGEGLWVTSYRRLSRSDAAKDSEVRRLIKKGKK